jgi:hypothetical protein
VRRPDIALAQELLDWSPAVELEEGLGRTLAAGRDRQRSLRDLADASSS